MFDKKTKAIELRKSGLSYRSIQARLGVSTSTISSWFSKEEWSKSVGKNLKSEASKVGAVRLAQYKKARGFALQFSYAKTQEDAQKEYKKYSKNRIIRDALKYY